MGKCFSKTSIQPRQSSLPIIFDFKTPFDHIQPIDLDSPLFNTPRYKKQSESLITHYGSQSESNSTN